MEPDSKAPKGDAQIAREQFLRDQKEALTPPAPEVEGASTPVAQAELYDKLPKPGKDVNRWKPGAENVKSIE